MMSGPSRFPRPARLLYRNAIFRVNEGGKKVYLTFDDGPTPGFTSEIISVLKQNNVHKAVFFCTGSNILKYPGEAQEIRRNKYSLANHGYIHMDGWKSKRREYIDNCLKGAQISDSLFFRPPYGRITATQHVALRKKMRIVFWDLLFGDYDTRADAGLMMKKAKKMIRPGSVPVLHDKGNRVTLELLVSLINHCRSQGYTFGDVTQDT